MKTKQLREKVSEINSNIDLIIYEDTGNPSHARSLCGAKMGQRDRRKNIDEAD